jgi:hypothetical protein
VSKPDERASKDVWEHQETTPQHGVPHIGRDASHTSGEPATVWYGYLERKWHTRSIKVDETNVSRQQVVHADLRLDERTHNGDRPL